MSSISVDKVNFDEKSTKILFRRFENKEIDVLGADRTRQEKMQSLFTNTYFI